MLGASEADWTIRPGCICEVHEGNVILCYSKINNCLISIREASCSALALFASVDPDTIKDTLLPSLLSLLSANEGLLLHLTIQYVYTDFEDSHFYYRCFCPASCCGRASSCVCGPPQPIGAGRPIFGGTFWPSARSPFSPSSPQYPAGVLHQLSSSPHR